MRNNQVLKAVAVIVLAAFFVSSFSGCAQMINAIEHSSMETKVKMTDTVFLDPIKKAKLKTVFVTVTNTSEFQEADAELIKNLITSRLQAKGYQIVDDPDKAGYMIQANLLYMDYYRNTGAKEGAIEGGLIGAGSGALIGQSRDTSIALAILGAMGGSVGGALLGKAIKVEKYGGVVDVQIYEKTDKPVVGKIETSVASGSGTKIQTTQEVNNNWQIYRTKIACLAEQTNINKEEAAKVIAEKLALQISGMF